MADEPIVSVTPGAAPAAAPAAPAAPAAAPTGAAGTLAGGIAAPAQSGAAPANWPDNWRDSLAGEDKAYRTQLDRFSDPAALAKSYKELQARVSGGQFRPAPPPADAPPEVVAAWRKEANLPGEAKDYVAKIALPAGMMPGENDKPLLESFAGVAHTKGWTPDQYNEALGWYYTQQDDMAKQKAQAEVQFRAESTQALYKEWGADFEGNRNAIKSLFTNAPEVGDRLLSGTTHDGRKIGDDPTTLRWLASIARDRDPMATLLPSAGMQAQKVGAARIAEIDTIMRTKPNEYWSNKDMQAEKLRLEEANLAMPKR